MEQFSNSFLLFTISIAPRAEQFNNETIQQSLIFQVDISRVLANIAVKERFVILFNIKLGLDKAKTTTP
jgi:hypothetical protein